jgi:hypothetical protein
MMHIYTLLIMETKLGVLFNLSNNGCKVRQVGGCRAISSKISIIKSPIAGAASFGSLTQNTRLRHTTGPCYVPL